MMTGKKGIKWLTISSHMKMRQHYCFAKFVTTRFTIFNSFRLHRISSNELVSYFCWDIIVSAHSKSPQLVKSYLWNFISSTKTINISVVKWKFWISRYIFKKSDLSSCHDGKICKLFVWCTFFTYMAHKSHAVCGLQNKSNKRNKWSLLCEHKLTKRNWPWINVYLY